MLIVNALFEDQSKLTETLVSTTHSLWNLLDLYEHSNQIEQYTLCSSEGTITDMEANFGWRRDFKKLVGVINWKKQHGKNNVQSNA